jgi:tRNA (cytidine/uridine-2'-O-)-methyltransferase
VHRDWQSCVEVLGDRRIFALSTRATARYTDVAFRPGDAFVFGSETAGLPATMLESFAAERRLRLPMRPGNRSLNLSNAVAVVVFEAWRQQGFAGAA